jgi:hypothetical protein
MMYEVTIVDIHQLTDSLLTCNCVRTVYTSFLYTIHHLPISLPFRISIPIQIPPIFHYSSSLPCGHFTDTHIRHLYHRARPILF